MRATLVLVVSTFAALAACKPTGARAPAAAAVAARPVVVDLAVTLDGKDVTTLEDGSTRIAGRGPGAFRVVATSRIDRHPYPGEALTAVLTTGERVVSQVPFTFDARHAKAKIDVPAAGTYRIEIWSQDQFVVGNTFVAASLPAIDGQRALELHQDAAPRLFLTRETAGGEQVFGGGVRVMHWDSIDTDTAYVAEWWLDGARIASAGRGRSELQREVLLDVQVTRKVLDHTAWRWDSERFELPDHLPTRPGHWELRVYREHHPALGFGFEITADGAVRGAQRRTIRAGSVELEVMTPPPSREAEREIARVPRTRFEPSKTFALGVTVAEVRALTRSEELRRLRVRLNELHHQTSRQADTIGFGESPLELEEKKLAATMKKMIAQLGEPWMDSERPQTGRRTD